MTLRNVYDTRIVTFIPRVNVRAGK